MAKSFRQYHAVLSPGWLLERFGARWADAFGNAKDWVVAGAKDAVKAKLPRIAPFDALDDIASERMLERGATETEAQFRARLVDAWSVWPWAGTAYGVLTALKIAGWDRVILAQERRRMFQLDAAGNLVITTLTAGWEADPGADTSWALFDVIFDNVAFNYWPGGPPAEDSQDAITIKRVIRTWKAGHAQTGRIIILTAGRLWGYPLGSTWATWNGGTWGGNTATYWTP